jgi:hypothetical protein
MGDDNIDGISKGGEKLRTDNKLEGIAQGQDLLEGNVESIVEGIERGPEGLSDMLLPEVGRGEGVERNPVVEALYELFRQRAELEERRIQPVTDTTTSAGESTAATIQKGVRRTQFEIFYNLDSGADDLMVEVSMDGNSWKPYASLDIPGGGDMDVATGQTIFTNVKAYPGEDFDDTDINKVQAVSAGGF